MDAETEQKLTFMARQIAAEMCRNNGAQMLPPPPRGRSRRAAR
jgi:hypothetical protein